MTILSSDQKLKKDDISLIKNAFKKQFGEGVTESAFRGIEQRLTDGEKIKGEHVLSAKLTALEILSPGLRFMSETLKAQTHISKFTHEVELAKTNLEKAEQQLKQRNEDWDKSGLEVGRSLYPGYDKPILEAEDNVKKAKTQLEEATKNLSQSKVKLEEGLEKLRLFNQSLDEPLLASQDEVKLKNQANLEEGIVGVKQHEVETLKKEILNLQKGVEEKERNLNDYSPSEGLRSVSSSGLTGELKSAKEQLQTAKENLDKANLSLEESKQALQKTNDKLTALKVGPHFRRAQQLMNNIGQDERFTRILDELSPGKISGGTLGKLEKTLTLPKPGEILEKVVTKAIPPVGVFKLFWSAIKAEDRERCLGTAKEHMKDFPLAQGLAESLAKASETEKWKLGFQGTFSFLSTALTSPLPGGHSIMGTVTGKMTESMHLVQPHHSFDQMVRSKVLAFSEQVQESLKETIHDNIKDTVQEKVQDKFQDELIESQMGMEEAKELRHAMKKLIVPDGTSMPVIPVKPFSGESGVVRDLPLTDPEVSIALLTYLGPPEDKGMLNSTDSKVRENEERRLLLRQEMFGAEPNEDLSPGKSKNPEQEKKLVNELNSKGTRNESFEIVKKTCPLHLLNTGLGLILH